MAEHSEDVRARRFNPMWTPLWNGLCSAHPIGLNETFSGLHWVLFVPAFLPSLFSFISVRPERPPTPTQPLPLCSSDFSPNEFPACLISFSICFLKDMDSHIWKKSYFIGIQTNAFSQFEHTHVSTQIMRNTLPVPEKALCSLPVSDHHPDS